MSLEDTALLQIYHQIRDSFIYELTLENSPKKLTEEKVRDLFYSPKKEERSVAYHAMMHKFEGNKDVLGEIYQSLVRDWHNEGIKLRKYSTPISIRNIANDVPDRAVESLLVRLQRKCLVVSEVFQIQSQSPEFPGNVQDGRLLSDSDRIRKSLSVERRKRTCSK